ncbi:hypothetical protein K492DRAFT_224601 [Lichtheimia hyalospora FSU 10163]|nr:hypothetical protein K492DRAFT_224601 [Lichtheimia hyalospora FSU 10163]
MTESRFAIKPGVIPQGDHCLLVSSYGKMERLLALDQVRQSQSPVIGLFSRNHVGALPSIRVGFNTDMQRFLSTVGLHKTFHQGAILSIVLSGRCKNDQDYGNWIVYTGTDNNVNIVNEEQTHDQTLKGYNLMLAQCCAAPVNAKEGSHANEHWLQGTPIRVIRGSGSVRHHESRQQKYMPYKGFRYDGIYKVVEYKPRKGTHGNIVWQFALRRCDSSPAPWTKKDKYNDLLVSLS